MKLTSIPRGYCKSGDFLEGTKKSTRFYRPGLGRILAVGIIMSPFFMILNNCYLDDLYK